MLQSVDSFSFYFDKLFVNCFYLILTVIRIKLVFYILKLFINMIGLIDYSI